jgi:hypothetical protein
LEMQMPDGQMRTVRDARNPDRIACMISGKLGGSGQIIAAHIMPHSVKATSLLHLGITRGEVDSVRNCLMLSTAIEKAFDRLDVSFVPRRVASRHVGAQDLDSAGTSTGLCAQALRRRSNHPFVGGSAFQIGMFVGHELFCGSNSVLKSALSNQARYAFLRSKSLGWVDAEDSVPDHSVRPSENHQNFNEPAKITFCVLGDPEARGAAAVAAAAALFASSCPYNLGETHRKKNSARSRLTSEAQFEFRAAALVVDSMAAWLWMTPRKAIVDFFSSLTVRTTRAFQLFYSFLFRIPASLIVIFEHHQSSEYCTVFHWLYVLIFSFFVAIAILKYCE